MTDHRNAGIVVETLNSEQTPVIAIRANDLAFMGLIRGIDAAGFSPICCVYSWPGAPRWYSEYSKYFANIYSIHNPAEEETAAVDDFIALGKALRQKFHKKALVLPSSDTVQLLFLRHERQLSPYFDLIGTDNFSSYRYEITHKGKFFELLQMCCPYLSPKTLRCHDLDQIDDVVKHAYLPAIVKPALKDYSQSFYRCNNGAKALLCSSEKQLRSTLIKLLKHGFDLVVQEQLNIKSAKDEIPFYAYVNRDHRICVAATAIKEFIQPAPFGTATILRLNWHPELLPLAQDIVSSIKWTGTFMIEFVRDANSDRWKVVEVNTRPWLFHDFFRQQGLPFVPHAILDHAGQLGHAVDPIVPGNDLVNIVRPLHLDIKSICQEICSKTKTGEENLKRLMAKISNYSNNFSLAHGTLQDDKPALEMFHDLSLAYDLNLQDLEALLLRN